MANNKIVFDGTTLIDLTADTVTENDVTSGKTFHLPSGEVAIGTGEGPDTITDGRYLFALSNKRVTDLKNSIINTPYMSYMFYNNGSLTDTDLSSIMSNSKNAFYIDTNQYDSKSLDYMFHGANHISNFDFDWINFNDQPVSMNYTFNLATSLSGILGSNPVNVNSMTCAFRNIPSLEIADFSMLKLTGTEIKCDYMFQNCTNLRIVSMLSTATGNIVDTRSMFSGCTSLITPGSFMSSVRNVTNAASMFNGCSSLQSITLTNLSCAATSNMNMMFNGCSTLFKVDMLWDCSNVSSLTTNSMFQNCHHMMHLVIRWTGGVVPLSSSSAFVGVPSTCRIWVPDDLVNSYKNATNWSARADYIFPLSEYSGG